MLFDTLLEDYTPINKNSDASGDAAADDASDDASNVDKVSNHFLQLPSN